MACCNRMDMGGLTMGHFELKYADIDRVILKFERSPFNHAKILICATLDGQFTCALGASTPGTCLDDAGSTIPMADLTAVRLKEAVSLAVMKCMKSTNRTVTTEADHQSDPPSSADRPRFEPANRDRATR